MVIRAPYGGGIHGALYHSQSVEALFGHMPGLMVVIPSNPYDAKGLLKAAIRHPDPVLFFEHKGAYRLIKGEVPDGDYIVELGKCKVAREGRDMTAVAWGMSPSAAWKRRRRWKRKAPRSKWSTCRRSRPWTARRSSSR